MDGTWTEIMRRDRREEIISYLERVKSYLENPNKKSLDKVIEAAKCADVVPRGFFANSLSLVEGVTEKMKRLKEGDEQEWAIFLSGLIKDGSRFFEELKSLSPFKYDLLLHVDYGIGFVEIKGLNELVAKIIRENKGWETYSADDYLVALPEINIEDAKVFWLRCGIEGVSGPRETEK